MGNAESTKASLAVRTERVSYQAGETVLCVCVCVCACQSRRRGKNRLESNRRAELTDAVMHDAVCQSRRRGKHRIESNQTDGPSSRAVNA